MRSLRCNGCSTCNNSGDAPDRDPHGTPADLAPASPCMYCMALGLWNDEISRQNADLQRIVSALRASNLSLLESIAREEATCEFWGQRYQHSRAAVDHLRASQAASPPPEEQTRPPPE